MKLIAALSEVYIDTGEPVSSAALSQVFENSGERVPPSTLRLELGKLERDGYLTKQHASGGRIPTSKAYRIYVGMLERMKTMPDIPAEIQSACLALSGELGRLLDYAGEVLARESGCLGFVTSPSLADAKIARLKLDAVEEDIFLLRLELSTGSNYHHLARMPGVSGNIRLDALAEILTDRLKGRRLGEVDAAEIESAVKNAARREREYDVLVHPLHNLITDARLGEGPRTVLHGAAGLLKASGDDAEALARAVEFLDNRTALERTLGRVPKPEEVKVVIGGDGASAEEENLSGFALVVASYHLHVKARGRLGILGPLRMPYARHLALVRGISETVSRALISRELSDRFA